MVIKEKLLFAVHLEGGYCFPLACSHSSWRNNGVQRIKERAKSDGALLPVFVAPARLKPFISDELLNGPLMPIEYMSGVVDDVETFGIVYDDTGLKCPLCGEQYYRDRETGLVFHDCHFGTEGRQMSTKKTVNGIQLEEYNWEEIETAVVQRIRVLAAVASDNFKTFPELREKIITDLVIPNVRLLAEFCANVNIKDEYEDKNDE
jgi:hypothetical protein